MAVNVKLLKKVRKLITDEPRRLDMEIWGTRYNETAVREDKSLPACGTVACLAGWIVLAAKPKSEWPSMFDCGDLVVDGRTSLVPYKAAELIGIDEPSCPFHQWRWGKPEVLAWIDRQIDAAK